MEISKFIKRSFLFVALNLLLLVFSLFFIHFYENRFSYKNWETESDLFIIPENKSFDLLILGSSHGRIFSRDKNHLRVEEILGKKMINLSRGGGNGGITPNYLFFKWFYKQENSTKQIIYFIDPWAFNSAKWNEESYFLAEEPINLKFLWMCIKNGVPAKVVLNYFKSKYTVFWLRNKPYSNQKNDKSLPGISEEALMKRSESLYIEPYNQKTFNKYAAQLEEIIQQAQANGAKITFIIPATLIKKDKGKAEVIKLLEKFKVKYGVSFYDYSNTIKDYKLYYDHDHLNTNGVVLFTKQYIKPLLAE